MSVSRQLDLAICHNDIGQVKQFSDADLLPILGNANSSTCSLSNSFLLIRHPLVQTNDEIIFEYLLAKMETYLREEKLTIDKALKTLLTELSLSLLSQTNTQNWLTDEKIRNFVSRLILLGTDLEARLPSRGSALYLAIERNYADVVSLLLLKGADPTLSCFFEVPYRFAERLGRTTILAVMKKHALRILNQYALILDSATGKIKFKNESLSAEKAILKYEQALACDPKNSLIYLFRGIVHALQENTEAAKQDFATAQTLGKSGRNQDDSRLWDYALQKFNASNSLKRKDLSEVYRELTTAIKQSDIDQIRRIDDVDLLAILGRAAEVSQMTYGHPLYQTYVNKADEEIFEYFLIMMECYHGEGKLIVNDELKNILSALSTDMMYQSNGQNWLSDSKIENYVCRLIALGTDVDFRFAGYTGLYLAVQRNYVSVVSLLLEKGADPTITGMEEIYPDYSDTGTYQVFKRTPYELAVSQNKISILKAMQDHAAGLRETYDLGIDIMGVHKCDDCPVEIYNRILACDPNNGLTYLFRGMRLFGLKKIEEAKSDFEMAFALDIDRRNNDHLRLLGMAYYHQEMYDSALECFKELYVRTQLSLPTFDQGMRGLCYHHLGMKDLAFMDLYFLFSLLGNPSVIFMQAFCDILLEMKKGELDLKDDEELFLICKKFPDDLQKILLKACLDSETGLGDRCHQQGWTFGSILKKMYRHLRTLDPDYIYLPTTQDNLACVFSHEPTDTRENLGIRDDFYLEFGL